MRWRTGQVTSHPGWNASARQYSARGAVEHGRLVGEGYLFDGLRRRLSGSQVGLELARGPELEEHVLGLGDRRVLPGLVLANPLHGVAIDPRPEPGRVVRAVGIAKRVQHLAAELGVDVDAAGRRLRRQPGQVGRVLEIVGAAPAELGGVGLIDPLHRRQPLEDRIDVIAERHARGKRQPAGLNVQVLEQVVEGPDAAQVRTVVGRGGDDPGGLDRDGTPVDLHLRRDRTVRHVVVPAVGVDEGVRVARVEDRRTGRRAGDPVAAEEDEPAFVVGSNLSEIDVDLLERPAELVFGDPRSRRRGSTSARRR